MCVRSRNFFLPVMCVRGGTIGSRWYTGAIRGRIPNPSCLPALYRQHRCLDLPVFQEKNVVFSVLKGTPVFFGRYGIPDGAGFPVILQDCPVFALFLCPLNCTVFSRLKRVFLGNNGLNKEFIRRLAPFPLPNFFGIWPGNLSVGEGSGGDLRSFPIRGCIKRGWGSGPDLVPDPSSSVDQIRERE
jgi:hypothetical protein